MLNSDQLTESIKYIESYHKAFENRYTNTYKTLRKQAEILWENGKRKWGIVEWYDIVYQASNIYDEYLTELYNSKPN